MTESTQTTILPYQQQAQKDLATATQNCVECSSQCYSQTTPSSYLRQPGSGNAFSAL